MTWTATKRSHEESLTTEDDDDEEEEDAHDADTEGVSYKTKRIEWEAAEEEGEEEDGRQNDWSTRMTCTLPPGCDVRPTTHASLTAFEGHYERYHNHLCRPCQARFPDARFLSLHQEEHHDPFLASRRALGLPVLRCFESHCTSKFATVTARRRHLQSEHAYPPEFRFNLVRRGLTRTAKSLLHNVRPARSSTDTAAVGPTGSPNKQETMREGAAAATATDTRERVTTTAASGEPSDAGSLNRAQRRARDRLQARSGCSTDNAAVTASFAAPARQSKKTEDLTSPRHRVEMKETQRRHARDIDSLFRQFDDPDDLEPKEQDHLMTDTTDIDSLSNVLKEVKLVPAQIKFGGRR